MPKSKNKRKNGNRKGSTWARTIAKQSQGKRDEIDATVARITKEMLGSINPGLDMVIENSKAKAKEFSERRLERLG